MERKWNLIIHEGLLAGPPSNYPTPLGFHIAAQDLTRHQVPGSEATWHHCFTLMRDCLRDSGYVDGIDIINELTDPDLYEKDVREAAQAVERATLPPEEFPEPLMSAEQAKKDPELDWIDGRGQDEEDTLPSPAGAGFAKAGPTEDGE